MCVWIISSSLIAIAVGFLYMPDTPLKGVDCADLFFKETMIVLSETIIAKPVLQRKTEPESGSPIFME